MSAVEDAAPDPLVPQEGFAVFYEREFQQVVALAFVLCGSWSSAEDLAQDAFASAQRRWTVVGAYDQPAAWVRRAVANRSVSLTRRRISEARALLRLGRPSWVEPAALDDGDEDLWRAVRELPGRQRQVIGLHYVSDLSVSEIAHTLQVTEATVKTHLQRGRRTLEVKLGERGESQS